MIALHQIVAPDFRLEGFEGQTVKLAVGGDQQMVNVLEVGSEGIEDERLDIFSYPFDHPRTNLGGGAGALEVCTGGLQQASKGLDGCINFVGIAQVNDFNTAIGEEEIGGIATIAPRIW